MNPVLDSVRDVVVVNDDKVALALSIAMRDGPPAAMLGASAFDRDAGTFYLYRDPADPKHVMETVIDPLHKDGITSVYLGQHRMFESRGSLIAYRLRLINALAAEVGLPAESIWIDDPGRGRRMELKCLATGQLIDLLQDRQGGGRVELKTDNYVNGVPA